MQGYRAPIDGFKTFASKPYLWTGPLFWSLLSAGLLAALFIFVMVGTWPTHEVNLPYYLSVFKSFGCGLLAVLIAWILVFPFVLAMAFDGMLKKLLREKNYHLKAEGLLTSIQSALFITWKTLVIRVVWGVLTLLCIFFIAPLGIFLTHMAIAHVALIDGVDLSLALAGRDKHFRLAWIRRNHFTLIMGGFVGGILSLILSITVIGWLFLLPSLYVGSALLVMDE